MELLITCIVGFVVLDIVYHAIKSLLKSKRGKVFKKEFDELKNNYIEVREQYINNYGKASLKRIVELIEQENLKIHLTFTQMLADVGDVELEYGERRTYNYLDTKITIKDIYFVFASIEREYILTKEETSFAFRQEKVTNKLYNWTFTAFDSPGAEEDITEDRKRIYINIFEQLEVVLAKHKKKDIYIKCLKDIVHLYIYKRDIFSDIYQYSDVRQGQIYFLIYQNIIDEQTKNKLLNEIMYIGLQNYIDAYKKVKYSNEIKINSYFSEYPAQLNGDIFYKNKVLLDFMELQPQLDTIIKMEEKLHWRDY